MDKDIDINPLLEKCSDEESAPLFFYIMENGDIAERLTDSPGYKKYFPKHSKYSDSIATEIRLFGGDSIANFFRRKGPSYKDIVIDVCNKFKIDCNKNSNIFKIEHELLDGFMKYIWEKLEEEEKKILVSNIQLKKEIAFENVKNNLQDFLDDKEVLPNLFFLLSGIFGFEFSKNKTNISKEDNIIIDFFDKLGLVNLIDKISNPISGIINSLISSLYFSGPNYKVTVPCVLHIAALRRKYENIININC